ncbi:MAG TPA: 4'-phosphopantetheinyl transferase superfamily protein [Sporichthyaceae bacterium]
MTTGAAPEVGVWWATPVGADPALWALLDDAERARHGRMHRPADRARFLTAHALARVVLGRTLGRHPAALRLFAECRHCGGPHGKLQLADHELELSLTHAGDRVGVAVATVPVGIDVEDLAVTRVDPALAAQVLSPADLARWTALPLARQATALLRVWTRGEAVVKALGVGLDVDPRDLPPDLAQVVDLDPGPGFIGSLAVLGTAVPAVRQHDGAELLLRATAA